MFLCVLVHNLQHPKSLLPYSFYPDTVSPLSFPTILAREVTRTSSHDIGFVGCLHAWKQFFQSRKLACQTACATAQVNPASISLVKNFSSQKLFCNMILQQMRKKLKSYMDNQI